MAKLPCGIQRAVKDLASKTMPQPTPVPSVTPAMAALPPAGTHQILRPGRGTRVLRDPNRPGKFSFDRGADGNILPE